MVECTVNLKQGWRKECESGLTSWEKPQPDNYWSDNNFERIRLWLQMEEFLVWPRSKWSDRFRLTCQEIIATARPQALNLARVIPFIFHQGCHKPGKHGKLGKLREFEKLSKSKGKLREIWTFVEKTWKTQGKWKICDMIANKNALIGFFSLELLREKV